MQKSLIPECYVDTKVAEIAGREAGKYHHQHSCGNVANKMIKSPNATLLGIIDQDLHKGPQANYFNGFTEKKTQNNLILKQHISNSHYLILVCPEIEVWLLRYEEAIGIDPTNDFGLPMNLSGLKSITKVQDIDKNIDFHRFIKALPISNNSAPASPWCLLYKR